MRDSFIFYRSFYESLQGIEEKDQLELFKAICEKALYGNDAELSGMAKNLFILIMPQLEANTKRYDDGKKGGRPKKK